MTDRRELEPQKQIMGLRQEDHLPNFPTAAVSEASVPML